MTVKKTICAIIILAMCVSLVSCAKISEDFPSLRDISADKVVEIRPQVEGDVSNIYKYGDGFLLNYTTHDPYGIFVAYMDGMCEILWKHKIGYVENMRLFGDWDIYVHAEDNTSPLRLSKNGQIETEEAEISSAHGLSSFHGFDSEHWTLGEGFLGYMNSEYEVVKQFDFLADQYPDAAFYPDDNSILLYGQAYKDSVEYGFVYEIDYDMNLKKYIEFENCVPRSVTKLGDGKWLISCYDRTNIERDSVKLFDSDWKETAIDIKYGFTKVFPQDNGGFAIVGRRLAPGQPEGALYMGSVRPKLDLVFELYDENHKLESRRTYPAENSNSGYGYTAYVDELGKIYLF